MASCRSRPIGGVRNTGTTINTFEIELQAANTGETATAYAFNVYPGQTATWAATFRGSANVHWVRTTSSGIVFDY